MGVFDEDELRDFVDYVKEFMCESTRIVYINDFDLMKLNMKDFDKNIYFISNPYVERGKAYEIIDLMSRKSSEIPKEYIKISPALKEVFPLWDA